MTIFGQFSPSRVWRLLPKSNFETARHSLRFFLSPPPAKFHEVDVANIRSTPHSLQIGSEYNLPRKKCPESLGARKVACRHGDREKETNYEKLYR